MPSPVESKILVEVKSSIIIWIPASSWLRVTILNSDAFLKSSVLPISIMAVLFDTGITEKLTTVGYKAIFLGELESES